MASRVLNRRVLRKQAEQAEPAPSVTEALPAVAPPKKTRKAPTKPRKPRAKKEPPRMRAHWCVFNNSFKAVALFDYNQRAEADAKLADLQAKKQGGHFLQLVKEPLLEPEPAVLPA